MKNLIFKLTFILAFSMFAISSACGTCGCKAKKNTVNIKIDGMKCEAGCAMYIQNELENMKGVAQASIDFTKSEGEITLKKRTSDSDIVLFINELKGGAYKASIIDNATNQINLDPDLKSCSKGKSCCQKTGQKVATCDNKSKGCCASASKKIAKNDNSISEMTPGHSGCQKACCAKK